VLYGIKFWKKKLQSCELISSMGDKLKSWAYDDDDEFDYENNNMAWMLQCWLKKS
jgi:hypothetical protein